MNGKKARCFTIGDDIVIFVLFMESALQLQPFVHVHSVAYRKTEKRCGNANDIFIRRCLLMSYGALAEGEQWFRLYMIWSCLYQAISRSNTHINTILSKTALCALK